jgi:hypothetical protein
MPRVQPLEPPGKRKHKTLYGKFIPITVPNFIPDVVAT